MKKIVLLLVVIVVVYLQEPGFDYTTKNRIVAAVKVWDSIEIDFDDLSSSLPEADVVARYSGLSLDCGTEPSTMGERSCYTNIRRANGVDAWFVAFFFDDDALSQVKIDLPAAGHKEMFDALRSQYGPIDSTKNEAQGNPIVGWVLKGGILSTNEETYSDRTTQVLWLSKDKLTKHLLNRLLKYLNK